MVISVVFLLAGMCIAHGDDARVDSKIEERWRREYPAAAAEWEQTARGFLAEGRVSLRSLNGTMITTKKLRVAASGDKRLFIRDEESIKPPNSPERSEDSVTKCETSEYAFALGKDETSKNYIVDEFGPYVDNDESAFQYWFKNFARNATVFLVLPCSSGWGIRRSS